MFMSRNGVLLLIYLLVSLLLPTFVASNAQ